MLPTPNGLLSKAENTYNTDNPSVRAECVKERVQTMSGPDCEESVRTQIMKVNAALQKKSFCIPTNEACTNQMEP